MFFVLQLPFIDVRPFLHESASKLTVPTWPNPVADKDFVRSAGPVRTRARRGVGEWPGENVFCDASKALRFPVGSPRNIQPGHSPKVITRKCIFRRYLTDGWAVSRFEVGFSIATQGKEPLGLTGRECLELVRAICRLRVDVNSGSGEYSLHPLIAADKALATHFLNATTKRGKPGLIPPFSLQAGEALLFVEYEANADISQLPKHARHVRNLHSPSITLSHLRVNIERRPVGVWLVGVDRRAVDPDYLRRVRLHLCRLHAEREAVKQVLRLVALGVLSVEPRSASSDHLQRFLSESTRMLKKRVRSGLPQSEILDVVMQYEDYVTEGERASLLSSLEHIRPAVLRSVSDFTEHHPHPAPSYVFVGPNITVRDERTSHVHNTQSITVNGDVSGVVQQTSARDIIKSLNAQNEQSHSPSAIKECVREVISAVSAIEGQVDEALWANIKQDVGELVRQTASSTPRKPWYTVSAKGLIEAGEAIGKIGEPIVTATKALLQLLEGGG